MLHSYVHGMENYINRITFVMKTLRSLGSRYHIFKYYFDQLRDL
jgi:hypothetical protein